jgi:predicted  nucleic acid-binding Zn-ribbon protein
MDNERILRLASELETAAREARNASSAAEDVHKKWRELATIANQFAECHLKARESLLAALYHIEEEVAS